MTFSNLLNAFTSPLKQVNNIPGLEPVYPSGPDLPNPAPVDSVVFIIITVACAVAIKYIYSNVKKSNQVPQE